MYVTAGPATLFAMAASANPDRVELRPGADLWGRFFTVAPLVIVGTREGTAGHDLAPKHMAMPLGWGEYFCFACTPRHATYRNIEETGSFTVSFPRPTQIVQSSFAASAREADDSKPGLAALETVPASSVDGVLVAGAYLWLECELDRVIDGFAENSLIIGRVLAASVARDSLRGDDIDDAELLAAAPLLAYLSPRRFAEIAESRSFPLPVDFKR